MTVIIIVTTVILLLHTTKFSVDLWSMLYIQALHSAEQYEQRSLKEVIKPYADQQHDNSSHLFSIQERNIVSKQKEGKSNQAIASELFLTTGTIKNDL